MEDDDNFDIDKKGNPFIFILHNLGNFAMLIMGFALIGGSLYIYSIAGKATYVDIFILTIGVSEAFLSCVAFQLRSSTGGITCYIFLMVVLLMCKLIASVLILVIFDKLVQMALPDDPNLQVKAKELITSNMKYLCYALLGAIIVLIFNIFVAMWYRATIKSSALTMQLEDAKPKLTKKGESPFSTF